MRHLRILTIISVVAIGSLVVNALSPIVRARNEPAPEPYAGPLFSMLLDEATKNKWQQEAREFDSAIREIEGITRLNLSTQQGNDEAVAILKRNETKLGFANSKIAASVLRVEKLKKGVEEEAAKRGGNKKFADEVKQNPGSAKNTPGLEEAGREGEASVQPARETLKKVADAFDAASKKQSSYTNTFRLAPNYGALFVKAGYNRPETCTVDLSSGSGPQNYCQSLGINVASNVCNIIKNVILLYLGVVTDNITCVSTCVRTAASRWNTCMTSASALVYPLNIAARATCTNTLITRTTVCFLNCD